MIFTTVGRVVAGVTIVLGIFVFVIGVVAASNPDGFAQNYPGELTAFKQIEAGLNLAFVGLALGVLSDISRSVMSRDAKRNLRDDA